MLQSSKILTAAALAGLGAMLAGFAAVSAGSARGVTDTAMETAAARIDGAFSLLPAAKGDLSVACRGQQWPDVAPSCLVKADGTPARSVRTVTVGTQLGEATTVLVRRPTPQAVAR